LLFCTSVVRLANVYLGPLELCLDAVDQLIFLKLGDP
jgi:hypothetical protein